MEQNLTDSAPQPQESLGAYIRRLRQKCHLSQAKLAETVGVHRQTISKIENQRTTRLNQRARDGLAFALGIPTEYLDAACYGAAVPTNAGLQYCPRCWTPGSAPDPIWLDRRSHYCFRCGTPLYRNCRVCQEALVSLTFRFCPYCGTAYKPPASELAELDLSR